MAKKNLTVKKVLKIFTNFYQKNNVKLQINRYKSKKELIASGEADCSNSLIIINIIPNIDPKHLAGTLMHEYFHIYCYRNNIYKEYHRLHEYWLKGTLTRKKLNDGIWTGLRAERHVDKLAEQFLPLIIPNIKYSALYSKQYCIKKYNKHYIGHIRETRDNNFPLENKNCYI